MQSDTNESLSNRDKPFLSRKRVMRDAVYAKNLFEEAFPLWRYGSVKAMTRAAHTFVSRRVTKEFTFRRARSIWEGKARRIDGEEIDALREAVHEEIVREQRELRTRLADLDKILAGVDAPSTCKTMAEARALSRRFGRMDR